MFNAVYKFRHNIKCLCFAGIKKGDYNGRPLVPSHILEAGTRTPAPSFRAFYIN